MSDYILANDHILANVLLRLPVDSLVRFRCISKSWRDLIDISYLVDMHCRRICSPLQTHRQCYSKMIALVGFHKFYTFDSVVKNGRKGYTAIAKRLRSPDMKSKEYGLELAESCNGIVLLCNNHNFLLWNPFAGSTLCSGELTSPPYEFRWEGWPSIHNAFGYDHLNDDYKLVKWHLDGAPKWCDWGKNLYQLCVYSFKHESWRTITDAGKLGLDAVGGYLPKECIFANGAMHWVVGKSVSHSKTNLILAFDLGTYNFQEIPCPPKPADYISLSSLNGCLCLGYTITRQSSVDVWVMKEYGKEGSWTKIACIDLRDKPGMKYQYMKVMVYSEKRGKLMLQPQRGKLMMYDLKTKSLRNVDIEEGEDEDKYRFTICYACVCVGSFVSPPISYNGCLCCSYDYEY